jgi:hypothetical protein
MDIVSGDRIILQLSTFEDRFLGIVAGVREDGRVMASVAMPAAALNRLRVDPHASVKYAHDGRLLGFSSRVLNIWQQDDTLVELEGPGTIFDAEERSEPRCNCCYPATMVEEGKAARGVVEDMSASCVRVRYVGNGLAPFPESSGRSVELTVHPFEMDEEGYSVGCSVVKSFMKNGERYIVLRFNSGDTDALRRISDFIETQACCILPTM